MGVSLVFVVASFIGFEATVIFGEEARDPSRAIPRATYCAVTLIALFYALCTWTITIHYGPANIARTASLRPDDLYFGPISELLGWAARDAADLLLLTSMFAATLSFHSTIARYLAAMAREGLCHHRLGAIHARHRSPHVAGGIQTAATTVMICVAAFTGLHPYDQVFAWSSAFGSIGILVIQLLTSISVVAFFRADGQGVPLFRRAIAPSLSAIALVFALYFSVENLPILSGSNSPFLIVLPALLVCIALTGMWLTRRLRKRAPAIYRRLGTRTTVSR